MSTKTTHWLTVTPISTCTSLEKSNFVLFIPKQHNMLQFGVHRCTQQRFRAKITPCMVHAFRYRCLSSRSSAYLYSLEVSGCFNDTTISCCRFRCKNSSDFSSSRLLSDEMLFNKRFFSSGRSKSEESSPSAMAPEGLSSSSSLGSIPIEDIYTKLTNLEHILLRPGMYIGSADDITVPDYWTYDIESNSVKKEELTFSPALLKVFDEILVNACDQKVRGAGTNSIRCIFRRDEICVENNGAGIPIEIHRETGEFLPQMLFGSLYTGSNFLDDKKQVVGGNII